jgi:RNA polymerase sporulation-specific sigma factor
MLTFLLSGGILPLLFLALHVTQKGAFPPPLSQKEEKELLVKTAAGDKKAREKLILHNLRLVAHIAKKYYSCGKETDDLISIGTIGLMKAINTYKEDKNSKLATYASRCIENEILMSLRWDKKLSGEVFFQEPIDFDSEGNPLTLLDVLAEGEDIPEMMDWKIKGERLGELVNTCLTPRERMILAYRYGLGDRTEMTQMELARRLNISRSYVSRIEKKALAKLRAEYEK